MRVQGRSLRILKIPQPQNVVKGFRDLRNAKRLIRPTDSSADPILQELQVIA
uniref:Uncharacterized protein MANES_07G104400 n=1 Tax=Rhizophora mucronata TaxID=61149 RepID=A0A2P2M296_RHIMU